VRAVPLADIAASVRAAADLAFAEAGRELDARSRVEANRHAFLRGIAAELHRAARTLETWAADEASGATVTRASERLDWDAVERADRLAKLVDE